MVLYELQFQSLSHLISPHDAGSIQRCRFLILSQLGTIGGFFYYRRERDGGFFYYPNSELFEERGMVSELRISLGMRPHIQTMAPGISQRLNRIFCVCRYVNRVADHQSRSTGWATIRTRMPIASCSMKRLIIIIHTVE